MKLPIGTPVLNLNSPTFAEDLAALLGISPGDTVNIVTPQFERTDGISPSNPPRTPEEWKSLITITDEERHALGLGKWDEEGSLWLFPKEWYNSIPDGLQITDINGITELFQKGITDDDYRFGCLAYGFLVEGVV